MEVLLKLTQLHEARLTGKAGMIETALKELGSTHKLKHRHAIGDATVDHVITMMHESARNHGMNASLVAAAYPLDKLISGLKKVQTPALFDIWGSLKSLMPLKSFMDPEQLQGVYDAAVKLQSERDSLLQYSEMVRHLIAAMAELMGYAKDKDEYKQSIAKAVLKNIGLIKKEAE